MTPRIAAPFGGDGADAGRLQVLARNGKFNNCQVNGML